MQDLSRHLKEAIALNLERMPLYADLSDGKTLPFSKKLIRSEKTLLYGAWIFDRIGDRLQEKGVPYLKDEFVEMATVPTFNPKYPAEVDYRTPIQLIDTEALMLALKKHIRTRDFEKLHTKCVTFLKTKLSEQTHVYCMLRHLLESMALISALVPVQADRCQKLGLKAPTAYSILLLHGHYWQLNKAKKMDEKVAPIQQSGIPFLFQDLPGIAIYGRQLLK